MAGTYLSGKLHRRNLDDIIISKVCKIPLATTFLEFGDQAQVKNLTECTTPDDYFAMLRLFAAAGFFEKKNKHCLPACVTSSYSTSVFTSNSLHLTKNSVNGITIALQYLNTNIARYEEYLLFDSIAIIAAVGGALGLFIGFSCFDCVKYILNKIIKE